MVWGQLSSQCVGECTERYSKSEVTGGEQVWGGKKKRTEREEQLTRGKLPLLSSILLSLHLAFPSFSGGNSLTVHYFQTHTCTHMYTQTGETGAWRVTWMNLIVCYSCVITPMKGLFHTHTRTCTEVLCVLYSWVVYKGVHVGHCWACTAQTTSTSHLDT